MVAALSRNTRKRALSIAKEVAPSPRRPVETVTAKVAVSSGAAPRVSTMSTLSGIKKAGPDTPAKVRSTPWVSVKVLRSELTLSTTLKCGQSFRWQREHYELDSGEISAPRWSCVLGHRLWFIQETEDGFQYRTFRRSSTSATPLSHESSSSASRDEASKEEKQQLEHDMKQDKEFLWDYFQLDVPLTDLYVKWSKLDTNFKAKANLFPGVRILRQDPVENLICFICSANNNISRISQMVTLRGE